MLLTREISGSCNVLREANIRRSTAVLSLLENFYSRLKVHLDIRQPLSRKAVGGCLIDLGVRDSVNIEAIVK